VRSNADSLTVIEPNPVRAPSRSTISRDAAVLRQSSNAPMTVSLSASPVDITHDEAVLRQQQNELAFGHCAQGAQQRLVFQQ
jgi:hypothetical protein